jgi:hypothetical protein
VDFALSGRFPFRPKRIPNQTLSLPSIAVLNRVNHLPPQLFASESFALNSSLSFLKRKLAVPEKTIDPGPKDGRGSFKVGNSASRNKRKLPWLKRNHP